MSQEKVKLICNECGKTRWVSADGEYNERCPKCGGVDWDVASDVIHPGHQPEKFYSDL